jgi:hypothetical protein
VKAKELIKTALLLYQQLGMKLVLEMFIIYPSYLKNTKVLVFHDPAYIIFKVVFSSAQNEDNYSFRSTKKTKKLSKTFSIAI